MITPRELLKLDRPLLGFDLETTGTNPKTARIVELALEVMHPTQPTREYRTLVNPTIPIPPGATAIHGITDDEVKDAPTFAQLAPSLIKGFVGADFCGYNVRFDMRIVAAEFARVGITFTYEDVRLLDAHRLWSVIMPRSLEDAAKCFLDDATRAVNQSAHNAMGDVKWSVRILASQIQKHSLPTDVQALHNLCWSDWYDAEGKLQWRDGQLCIAFGEHREVPLREVPSSYLTWILKKDFSAKVKDACRDALRGVFPTQPKGVTNVEGD